MSDNWGIKFNNGDGVISLFNSSDVRDDLKGIAKNLAQSPGGQGILGSIQLMHDTGILDKNKALENIRNKPRETFGVHKGSPPKKESLLSKLLS